MNTTNPHWSTNEKAKDAFQRNIKTRPDVAVQTAIALGFAVLPADVPTPFMDTLARFSGTEASAFSWDHAAQLAIERKAVALLKTQGRPVPEPAAPRDAIGETLRAAEVSGQDTRPMREALRERFVIDRIAALEAEHEAALRDGWKAQAEQEATAKFGALPVRAEPRAVLAAPPPPPAPAPAVPAPPPRRRTKAA